MNEKLQRIMLWIEKACKDLGLAVLTYRHISDSGIIIDFHG
jgi:hypothetical protein